MSCNDTLVIISLVCQILILPLALYWLHLGLEAKQLENVEYRNLF